MHSNKTRPRGALPLILATLLLGISSSRAAVSLPSLFSDHMVLQRDKPIRVWGTADPGEPVSVSLGEDTMRVEATATGQWSVELPARAAGGPLSLTVSGRDNSLTFTDVLVGEVWVASGQSNMQWNVGRSVDADLLALTAGAYGRIRYLNIGNPGTQEPQWDVDGQWTVVDPDSVSRLSAVAYAFARTLHNALGVPVGILSNPWGGSAAEAWVPRSSLRAHPELVSIVEHWEGVEATYDYDAVLADFQTALRTWEEAYGALAELPPGTPQKPRQPLNALIGNQRPANIWNARVLPIIQYPVRGVIWYQGEANARNPLQYRTLFPTLIRAWRNAWGEELPFYWVQLADFMAEAPVQPDSNWATLREAQTMTMDALPRTGQAVITDLGEANDIHPQRKEEVGRRLARWALHHDYGFTALACRSPEVAEWEQVEDRILVRFAHTGSGLKPVDSPDVRGFTVRTATGEWSEVPGKVIAPDTVQLQLPDPGPIEALRYAWADNPVCNLFSLERLPVTPYRSDRP